MTGVGTRMFNGTFELSVQLMLLGFIKNSGSVSKSTDFFLQICSLKLQVHVPSLSPTFTLNS